METHLSNALNWRLLSPEPRNEGEMSDEAEQT
jgi:hypothetical protein